MASVVLECFGVGVALVLVPVLVPVGGCGGRGGRRLVRRLRWWWVLVG